jgi:fermentation-respiration switch protein FrsA (DUF1100 family)
MGIITYFFVGILLAYTAINGYLYFFQRKILYLPAFSLAQPHHYGLQRTEEVKLHTQDGLELTAWLMKPKRSKYYMIYLQGNAGNMGDRIEKLEEFSKTGWNILAVNYRGYGSNPGTPSEEGLYLDARAAIAYLQDQGVKLDNIILYGESLGSGVAIQMATEYKFKSIILEAPYTSIVNRAKELYPYIPISLLIKDRFESINKISKTSSPLLMFHGYRDEVMPIHHGRRLLMEANDPKQAHFFDHVGHTDFDLKLLTQYMKEFVNSH